MEQPGGDEFRYWAFISYSHADAKWGDWLHTALETYRVPARLVRNARPAGAVPRRVFPVFRDREELASSASLGENIQNALRLSRALVVICSPRAAASRWVNEEIKLYKSMGREDRVFCLIVDGEPYAKPDSGLLECFPKAVLLRLDDKGELSSEPAEPIAADAREGKDGKRNALLKLIAGIVGVSFDELRQRERQRQLRQRIRVAALAVAVTAVVTVTYLGIADAGLGIPGAEAIRARIDRYELSAFRRAHSEGEIRRVAAALRQQLVDVFRQRLHDGWISATPPDMEKTAEVWAHAQATFAIFRMPDQTEARRQFVPCLAVPFAAESDKDEYGRRLPWGKGHNTLNDPDGLDYEKSIPSLWMISALAAALQKPDALTEPERQAVLGRMAFLQDFAKRYHPVEDGGWNMVASQKDPARHHLYSTTVALLALLQVHAADAPWEGSKERRDELIRQTARWLVERFDATGNPPGWRGISEDTRDIYDGLTIQIFAELLQTRKALPDFTLPAEIADEIPRQLTAFARRDLTFPVNGGQFTAFYTGADGSDLVGKRLIKYLWYPWVIDCAVTWLEQAEREGRPKEQRVQVRRALGHLIVDLGDEALRRAKRDYTFFASEDLYGLTAIRPPE
ncbi:MAG TPA: toll/interleukin-1 receptor domain-containing protein [Chthoniobacterales bacterium]|jgi:hypothetical protein|nr:toll/interleukin-1 receptor domain-containing protein [Chthoniobacterales bacterium]